MENAIGPEGGESMAVRRGSIDWAGCMHEPTYISSSAAGETGPEGSGGSDLETRVDPV